MASEKKEEMFSSGRLAKDWDVSPAKIKKAIQKLGLEPDEKKGNCAYYSPQSAMKIKNELDKG